MRWTVSFIAAFRSWVEKQHPPVDVEWAMVSWLQAMETAGPPGAIGRGRLDLPIALGPNGEMVMFVVASGDDPTRGYIGIIEIASRPETVV